MTMIVAAASPMSGNGDKRGFIATAGLTPQPAIIKPKVCEENKEPAGKERLP